MLTSNRYVDYRAIGMRDRDIDIRGKITARELWNKVQVHIKCVGVVVQLVAVLRQLDISVTQRPKLGKKTHFPIANTS